MPRLNYAFYVTNGPRLEPESRQFAVEELLLFEVLLLVKHRLPSIFDRFVRHA